MMPTMTMTTMTENEEKFATKRFRIAMPLKKKSDQDKNGPGSQVLQKQ